VDKDWKLITVLAVIGLVVAAIIFLYLNLLVPAYTRQVPQTALIQRALDAGVKHQPHAGCAAFDQREFL